MGLGPFHKVDLLDKKFHMWEVVDVKHDMT